MTDGPNPELRDQLGPIGMATGLGCSVVVTLVMTIGGGVLLDRWRGTEPVFTLVGLALGLLGAGYELWELTKVGGKPSSRKPPLSRGIERVSTTSRKRKAAARPEADREQE